MQQPGARLLGREGVWGCLGKIAKILLDLQNLPLFFSRCNFTTDVEHLGLESEVKEKERAGKPCGGDSCETCVPSPGATGAPPESKTLPAKHSPGSSCFIFFTTPDIIFAPII